MMNKEKQKMLLEKEKFEYEHAKSIAMHVSTETITVVFILMTIYIGVYTSVLATAKWWIAISVSLFFILVLKIWQKYTKEKFGQYDTDMQNKFQQIKNLYEQRLKDN